MATKRKTRLYEPWGYQEENNYNSTENVIESDFEAFLVGTSYNKDDNKIYFTNKDGEVKASLDVSEFVKSDSIIDHVDYNDGILTITFTNGDVITIDLTQLLDENEFKDGLIVKDHVVKVLIDSIGEPYLSVSEDGIKISGVDAAIQVETDRATSAETILNQKLDEEIARATSAETVLDEKIEQETADRIADVDAEEARATSAETVITTNLNNEISRATSAETVITTNLNNEVTRATQTEQQLNHRINIVNDELDTEQATREANDATLKLKIDQEIVDRKAAINEEKARSESAETALHNEIVAEAQRAQSAETEIDDKVNEIISGETPIKQLDDLIEKLGYADNDTLTTNNPHEVAFGEWNDSHTSEDPSGQTIFSIGIGTDENNRKNALEIRKDGSIWTTVEGEYIDIVKILGQLVHEVYDTDTNP